MLDYLIIHLIESLSTKIPSPIAIKALVVDAMENIVSEFTSSSEK